MRPHVSKTLLCGFQESPFSMSPRQINFFLRWPDKILNWIKPEAGRDAAKGLNDDFDITDLILYTINASLVGPFNLWSLFLFEGWVRLVVPDIVSYTIIMELKQSLCSGSSIIVALYECTVPLCAWCNGIVAQRISWVRFSGKTGMHWCPLLFLLLCEYVALV